MTRLPAISAARRRPLVAAAVVGAPENVAPLGPPWGCMTRRTGSFVPATLAHAVNLWGLQNLRRAV